MKTGRNDPCHCGSGKKYKHCCYAKDSVKHEAPVVEAPETDSDAVSEDDSAAAPEAADRDKTRSGSKRASGRDRFFGDARGRSTSFKPRTHRGSQRGQ